MEWAKPGPWARPPSRRDPAHFDDDHHVSNDSLLRFRANMPIEREGRNAQGAPRFVRRPYQPADYTMPPGVPADIRAGYRGFGTRDLLEMRDGAFMGYAQRGDVIHDGKPYVVLTRNARVEFAIEVELTDRAVGDIRAVPPEHAWELARAQDAARVPPIEIA